MRIKVALGICLLAVTLAWIAVAPPDLGLSSLRLDAPGGAVGWWQLLQHTIYLSGPWSISLIALVFHATALMSLSFWAPPLDPLETRQKGLGANGSESFVMP